ncbi:MAG: amino acid ABC transporter permease [Halothece sp.]
MNTIAWLKQNLFNTWPNTLLTLICLFGLGWILKSILLWTFTQADWLVIKANLALFFAGRYPQDLYWRLWVIVEAIAFLAGLTWGTKSYSQQPFNRVIVILAAIATTGIIFLPIGGISRLGLVGILVFLFLGGTIGNQFSNKIRKILYLFWILAFPISLWLIGGGLGVLEPVRNNLWTGLVLTLLTAIASIFLSFPIGVLLALGRQSQLPIVKYGCILYIELIRGLPLIGILFMAINMFPFFTPVGVSLDDILKAIAGLTLFSAAYLAENVRGGLQSIPKGQYEAAKALGLNTPVMIGLIILPQALKAVIPALVGQFIGLFKDTSLLSLVGLIELMGISRSILANPNYIGEYAEVYLFVGAIYFVFCYGMSVASRRLEEKYN